MRQIESDSQRQIFGKLGSVSLNDIVQFLGMAKRTATLELVRGSDRGRLYFRDGQVIHATAGPYEGEESFIELLGWDDAEFVIDDGIDSLTRTSIDKSTEALLLSTMTALDEVGRVVGKPPARIGVSPSITERRRPPLPRPRPKRSSDKRTPLIVGGLIAITFVPLVGMIWLLSGETGVGEILSSEPSWTELPAIPTPSEAPPRAEIPDAWVVAAGAWDDPLPVRVQRRPPIDPSSPVPPPAITARPSPGYLTVVVEPWGRVAINGTTVGETPLGKIELAPGAHRLTVANDHVVGIIQDDVVVESGSNLVRRYSFDDVGYLRLVVSPWANVSVDGRAIGQTPLGQVTVPAGLHTVRFVHPELGEIERSVRVTSGQTSLVKVELP